VIENLVFFADIFGVAGKARQERITRLLSFARLEKFTARRAGNLSGGMKQKLALSCALVHEPALLLLDEPTIGVDPASRREFWRLLAELTRSGSTILISTPYMDETDYCDRLSLLHEGVVLHEGTPEEFRRGYEPALYRVVDEEASLIDESKTDLPKGIVRLYYAAGEIRIVADRAIDRASVLGAVRSLVAGVSAVEPVAVTMEDVFIHELAVNGAEVAA
jgi:ABC-2 type transport system ATP-binding protein